MAAEAAPTPPPSLTKGGATAFQYRSNKSALGQPLIIPKRTGHRRTLVDIFFEPPTAGVFLDVQIGSRLYMRVPTALGDANAGAAGASGLGRGIGFVFPNGYMAMGYRSNLWLLQQYIPFDLPTAAEDEDIIITPQTPLSYGSIPANYLLGAYYIDQDTGDVTSHTVPGGSAAPKRVFFNLVTNGLPQQTTGQTALDTLITPQGLDGIYDRSIGIIGEVFDGYVFAYDASSLGTTTGTNANGKPTRLHVIDFDTELFEPETTEGMLIDRDLGNAFALDVTQGKFFYLQQPYRFQPNRTYRMLLDTVQPAGTGVAFGAKTQTFMIVGIRQPATGGGGAPAGGV